MKQIILLVLILITCFALKAQDVRANRIIADKELFVPVIDTNFTPHRVGQITYKVSDGFFYYAISMSAPKKWERIARYTDLTGITDTHAGNTNLTQTGTRNYTGAGFDYNWNGLGNWYYNLNSGKEYIISRGFFDKLYINPSTGIYAFGDISGEDNNTFLHLNAANTEAKFDLQGFNNIYMRLGRTTFGGYSSTPSIRSQLDAYVDSISIEPYDGNLYIDNLNKRDTASYVLGMEIAGYDNANGQPRYKAVLQNKSLISGATLASVGGGLDVQTGGAGDIRTLNTDDHSVSSNLISVKKQMSITGNSSGLKLDGDASTPGNTKLYGTNGSGVKGWYDQPAGGSGDGGIHSVNVVAASGLIKVNDSTLRLDTLSANAGAAETKAGSQKKIDSLLAILNIVNNPKDIYDYEFDVTGESNAFFRNQVLGTGSAAVRDNAQGYGTIGTVKYSLGTSTSGVMYGYTGNSGVIQYFPMSSSIRYNFGIGVRFETLSDGTDTYKFHAGMTDDHFTPPADYLDIVCFSYTHSESSGQFVCRIMNNGSETTTASGITVAAGTTYWLQISVFGGEAKFYIDGTLVTTMSGANLPDDDLARTVNYQMNTRKSAGTNNRNIWINRIAYGTVKF